MPGDRAVTYVGMVICRQRPKTETGVTFMTLEDETGLVNLVVWRPVYERFELVAKAAALLEVHGTLQREHGVVHLIAERLAEPALGAAKVTPRSRDFH